ncbi:helix-turn-helix domain-containing protein [Streptomyces sp. KLMMK]|uniref:AraC-like ligand-binding domain-containing protein n=1 Tax=Streptomyces sp. KLMMK TaxID=3109353 RepID=UPI003009125E
MRVTEFSTDVVAPPERFGLFRDVTARSHMPNRLRSNDYENFRARMQTVDFGELQVSALAFPHLDIARTAKLIRQADPEIWQVNYMLGAQGGVSLDGADANFQVGDLLFMGSSRPYRGNVHTCDDSWSQLVLQFPRRLLPLPERLVQGLLAVPIGTHSGMGGVLARWMADLNGRAHEFTDADVNTLGSVTLDLLASVVARCLDSEDTMDPESRRRALQMRIHDFIRQRLADPSLTPEAIAAAHGVSTRHLYTLFRDQGLTVAAWIRQCRLEQCRHDLADPQLRSRHVRAVAARWGFTDPAHFSRTFRAAYAMTPTDYRHHALDDVAQERTSAVQRQSRTVPPHQETLGPEGPTSKTNRVSPLC